MNGGGKGLKTKLHVIALSSTRSCLEFGKNGTKLPYTENFKEETFCEFHGFVAICKSFLHEIWGVASFGAAKASNLRKFSPRKL